MLASDPAWRATAPIRSVPMPRLARTLLPVALLAIALPACSAAHYAEKGDACAAMGRHAQAAAYYQRALAKDPYDRDVQDKLRREQVAAALAEGDAAIARLDCDRAEAEFRTVLRLQPGQPRAEEMLARLPALREDALR